MLSPFGMGQDSASDAQNAAMQTAKEAEARRLAHDPIALGNNVAPSAGLLTHLAGISCASGNVPQARAMYQKALSMEPKNLDALLGAARMEDREGRMDVAVMLYERAAAAYPNNPTVMNDLGLCLARQGDLPAAEQALARAVQLVPAKPLYRNNIAKVQVEMNRLDAAMNNLAAIAPPAVVNYNMGALLCQRGRPAEAEQFLAAAIAVDPRMEPARMLLAELGAGAPAYRTARAPEPAARVATSMTVSPPESDTSAPVMPTTESTPTLLPPVSN
jgi:Tfp pilus assembly protein PilF